MPEQLPAPAPVSEALCGERRGVCQKALQGGFTRIEQLIKSDREAAEAHRQELRDEFRGACDYMKVKADELNAARVRLAAVDVQTQQQEKRLDFGNKLLIATLVSVGGPLLVSAILGGLVAWRYFGGG